MLPLVTTALTIARYVKGYIIPEAATMARVVADHVCDAENFLEDAPCAAVGSIARRLALTCTPCRTLHVLPAVTNEPQVILILGSLLP